MSVVRRWTILALLSLVVVTGCSGGGSKPQSSPDTSAGATTAAPPPKPPAVGACYLLTVQAALATASSTSPVPCSSRHTAATVAVGTVQPVVDGHLLALDSAQVQGQVASQCRHAVDAHVGGSTRKQQLSRVQAVWFTPTPGQVDRGALWYRCDVVIASGSRTFAALPKKTKGLLAATGAMNRWGTCGTTAPSSAHFKRVLCSARHSWRARSVITLPTGTSYLSKVAGRTADGRCRGVAARLSPKSTTLRWSFEWPTRDQWRSGQRYGLCWTPD